MATQNQLVVAEAIAIARKHGRFNGLKHLITHYKGKRANDVSSTAWFMAKCDEHGIPGGHERVVESFRQLAVTANEVAQVMDVFADAFEVYSEKLN